MFRRLRARLLARLAKALAPHIAGRIEEEVGARMRRRTLEYIDRQSLGLRKSVAEERAAQVNVVFPPQVYRERRRH